MGATSASDLDLYPVYRHHVQSTRMPESLRTGILVVVALNTAFVAFDLWAFKDRFQSMLVARAACVLVLMLIYALVLPRRPLLAAFAGCFATGAMLLWVIYQAGGAVSEYSPGLMLLFVGIPVLIPFSAPQAAWIVSVLFAGYAIQPMISGESIAWRDYIVHVCFPMTAGLECLASTALLDRFRFSDFKQRLELETARDELKELDRAKSRFTANIHHELRTPLTLVLSPLEAMLGGEFGDIGVRPRQYLHTMQVNALRLLKLINNLLDLAKAESGGLALRRRPIEPGRLLADIVAGARPMAERKHVRLETRGLEALPGLNADPDALEKIVMNLLGNALKFTEAGGTIVVSGEVQPAEGPEGEGLCISVLDTGAGIPPDQLERIFDRFAQVDASATRKYEGTGIGLSLVKELVMLHGGRVWAESDGLGRGSRFHVLLPRGEEDAALEEEVLQSESGRGVALGRSLGALEAELDLGATAAERSREYRTADLARSVDRALGDPEEGAELGTAATADDRPEIVIAEDNGEMRRLLAHLLSHEFRVREAKNGREALALVCERAPDLVLTDVMMPELSGTELCRALKSDAETAGIPVVLVTSKAEREMKVEGLELGADDYVTKPFHPRELLARVRGLVRLRRLSAEVEERNEELEAANVQLAKTLEDLNAAQVQIVQAERLAAVGELAAGVAHEVNNPVNFALNAVRMLKLHMEGLTAVAHGLASLDLNDPTKLPGQTKQLLGLRDQLGIEDLAHDVGELVSIASEGLERTQRLVGDLKDFAAPGRAAGAPVDVARGLRSTLQLLAHTLAAAGVRVEAQIAAQLPSVHGDAAALNQVWLNLLKNAGEALETRGGTIGVEARSEGGEVVVQIRDDGPGVSDEVRARLFQPFVSTKEAGRGTGLGLSICHRIVTEHGGTLELASGAVTVFTIRLPAEEPDAA